MIPPTRAQLRELARVFNRELLLTKSVEDALAAVLTRKLAPLRSAESAAIMRAVAARFSVPPERLFDRSRQHDLVQPRHVAMLLMRQAGMEHWRISRSLGMACPSTSIHGCRQALKSERLRSIAGELAVELGILGRASAIGQALKTRASAEDAA